MYPVLLTLILLDALLIAVEVTLGITLTGPRDVNRHYLLGLLVSMFTCFIHCLVLFYLIGTGKDIRDAVEDHSDLAEEYFPWTNYQKRRAFPPACFALALMVFAALMGGEVHSRLLGAMVDDVLPLRGVSAWWVHLVAVVAAVLTSAYAFVVELAVVRDNRAAIGRINAELARREGPAEG